jgi:hypothetical protein
MKRTGFIVAAFLLLSVMAFGQANQVVGFWLTAEGDSQVEIYANLTTSITDGLYG